MGCFNACHVCCFYSEFGMNKYNRICETIDHLQGDLANNEDVKDAIETRTHKYLSEFELEAELIKFRLYELLYNDGWIEQTDKT